MSLYQSVLPLSQRADGRYNPSDTIDFVIDYAGREIVPGSFRISGSLSVITGAGGGAITGDSEIYIDSATGAHGCFQQYITSIGTGSVIENFQHVPRYVAMTERAQNTLTGSVSTLAHVVELKADYDEHEPIVLAGVPKSFSIKPIFGLNFTDKPLGYSKFGQLKISCLLSSVTQLVFGADCDASTSYYLSDLQLDFKTVAESYDGPVNMRVISSLKQSLSSPNQQLSVVMPISSSAVTMSFVPLATENVLENKYTRLAQVPGVSRVEFSFNDIVFGTAVTFALEDNPEIEYNALESMDSAGKHALLADGTNYMIGTTFGDRMLINTKVGVNIQSTVAGAQALALYMYFKGVTQM